MLLSECGPSGVVSLLESTDDQNTVLHLACFRGAPDLIAYIVQVNQPPTNASHTQAQHGPGCMCARHSGAIMISGWPVVCLSPCLQKDEEERASGKRADPRRSSSTLSTSGSKTLTIASATITLLGASQQDADSEQSLLPLLQSRNWRGWTALHVACYHGHKDVSQPASRPAAS